MPRVRPRTLSSRPARRRPPKRRRRSLPKDRRRKRSRKTRRQTQRRSPRSRLKRKRKTRRDKKGEGEGAEAQDAQTEDAKTEDAKSEDEGKTKKRKGNSDAEAKKSAKQNAAAEAATGLPAVLVVDNGDLRALNLYYGIGGKKDVPDPKDTYIFEGQDLSQTQPKVDVRDAEGRKWRIKTGVETRAETAATRLVWAAGYFTDEDYYMERVPVEGLPHHLKRTAILRRRNPPRRAPAAAVEE